jgi:hypothetical protein
MASTTTTLYQLSPFITVCIFLLLLIVTWGWTKTVCKRTLREAFTTTSQRKDSSLIDPKKLMVYQGVSVPRYAHISELDEKQQVNFPSVDGTAKGPRSMFTLAYNKCAPECCGQSGGLSCDRGCVCLTKEQKKMFNIDTANKSCLP